MLCVSVLTQRPPAYLCVHSGRGGMLAGAHGDGDGAGQLVVQAEGAGSRPWAQVPGRA